jgi:hypothetical protein
VRRAVVPFTDCEPVSYKDPASGVTFTVEKDGAHLVATGADGRQLWRREPHADAKVQEYRTATPCIVFMGVPQDRMIKGRSGRYFGISFNNSQFGIVDIGNGDFTFMGQD